MQAQIIEYKLYQPISYKMVLLLTAFYNWCDLKPKSEEANQEPTRRKATFRPNGVVIVLSWMLVLIAMKGEDLLLVKGDNQAFDIKQDPDVTTS